MATSAVAVGLIDWSYLGFLFLNISPYFWSAMGIAACVGLSILGAAWCVREASASYVFETCVTA